MQLSARCHDYTALAKCDYIDLPICCALLKTMYVKDMKRFFIINN